MLQLWITYYYYNYYLCKQLYCVTNAEMFLNVAEKEKKMNYVEQKKTDKAEMIKSLNISK